MNSPAILVREARDGDLPQVYDIYYADAAGTGAPARPAVLLDIRHEYAAGTMLVAARGGTILGFASLTMRERIAFLSSLFVRVGAQSAGLGRRLLDAILPGEGHTRCTLSSGDPRAIALYTRFGMRPLWPNLLLRAHSATLGTVPAPDVTVVEAPAHEDVLRWDAEIAGRQRPMDHAYWMEQERALSLLFARGGAAIGYGYLRLGAGTFRHPEAATLGPIGARTATDALACTLAAVRWSMGRAPILRIDVPGPHPALGPLLEAGFQIIDADTFCLAGEAPFADPRRYVSSGGSLF